VVKKLFIIEEQKNSIFLKPSTYKYRDYKEGQFVKRQYRVIAPEVEAGAKGLDEVTFYKVVDGKVVKVTEKATTFPYDSPKSNFKMVWGEKYSRILCS